MPFHSLLAQPIGMQGHPADYAFTACDEVVWRTVASARSGRIICLKAAADSLTAELGRDTLVWLKPAIEQPYLDADSPRYLFEPAARVALAESVSDALLRLTGQPQHLEVQPEQIQPEQIQPEQIQPGQSGSEPVPAEQMQTPSVISPRDTGNSILTDLGFDFSLPSTFWTSLLEGNSHADAKRRRKAARSLMDSPQWIPVMERLSSLTVDQVRTALENHQGPDELLVGEAIRRLHERLLARKVSTPNRSATAGSPPSGGADSANGSEFSSGTQSAESTDTGSLLESSEDGNSGVDVCDYPMHANELITRFEKRLSAVGSEPERIRELIKHLRQMEAEDMAILVCHQNLRNHGSQPIRLIQSSRPRTMRLVPKAFIRLTDACGTAPAVRIGDLLKELPANPDIEMERRQALKVTLACGLIARTHLVHSSRRERGQSSSWNSDTNGLYVFNMYQHVGTVPGFDPIGKDIQCLLTEMLLDAGKGFDPNTRLLDVWNPPPSLLARQQEKVRAWARETDFATRANRNLLERCSLSETLAFAVEHGESRMEDPLRISLASRLLALMSKTLQEELAKGNA